MPGKYEQIPRWPWNSCRQVKFDYQLHREIVKKKKRQLKYMMEAWYEKEFSNMSNGEMRDNTLPESHPAS